MIGAVRNAMTLLDLPLADAVGMASAAPAAFLGLAAERGAIAKGQAADLVLLDDALDVRQTWINGAANL
jgi:N-acetylglucosamine-6-phosphate deacetylase